MIVMSPEADAAVAGSARRLAAAAAHPAASAAFAGAVLNKRGEILRGIGTTGATPGRD
jgi:hypothetical protein